jgi:ABC-2 type transport system ATP-binding protein
LQGLDPTRGRVDQHAVTDASPLTPPPPSACAAIEAIGLTRRFGAHVALDGLDLTVPRNTTFGLLGANGAGKTTFLRLVAGLLLPSRGRVRVDGRCPVREARAVARQIGFVMETGRLYRELSVAGMLRFAAGARGLRGAAATRAIERVTERFALGGVSQRLIGHLSKGTRQRIALAHALVHDPPLVIADEPTSGLDPAQRREVWTALANLAGRRTVLICTHDLEEARALCSRVAVLQTGRLVAEGATHAVLGGSDPLALFRAVPAAAAGGRHP